MKTRMNSRAACRAWAEAFRDGRAFASARHNIDTDGTAARLHGNKVAWRDKGGTVWVSSCGWETMTTCDRIQAVLRAMGDLGHVSILGRKLLYTGDGRTVHLDSRERVAVNPSPLAFMAIRAAREAGRTE